MKRLLLAVAALAAAQPAMAREDVEVGDWTISGESETCTATAFYDESVTKTTAHVALSYNALQKYTFLMFSNSKATSLKADEQVELTVAFKRLDGSYDEGWGLVKFEVSVMDSGLRFFASRKFDNDMLDDFARSKLVAFFTGTQPVSTFPLEGSAAAVAELKKCAFEVAGLNPLDPFLKD